MPEAEPSSAPAESPAEPSAAPSAAPDGDYRYAAFISYRHTRKDRKWAKWLSHTLEAYVIPPKLRPRPDAPGRLGRVFRDEDELAASADLKPEIEQALRDSRYLIVVCSPRTPASEWVNVEVQKFRELGRNDRILALLIEGEPADSFPRALREIRRTLVDQGGLRREEIERVEPLAADVRTRWFWQAWPWQGGHAGRMAKLRLLSCLLGVRFDDLRQREQERRNRRMRVVRAAMAALVAVMFGLTTFALVERKAARANEAEAVAQAADADRQRKAAQASEKKAVEQATLAEQRRQAAQAAEAKAVAQADLARQRLNDIRWMAHSKMVDFNNDLAHIAGTTRVRLDIAMTAQNVLNGLARSANTPELKKELIEAYFSLGDILANLITKDMTNLPSVGQCYQQGLNLAEQAAKDAPGDRDALRLLAGAYRRMANAQRLSEIQSSRVAPAAGGTAGAQPVAQYPLSLPLDDVGPEAVLDEARKRADRARAIIEPLVAAGPDRDRKGEEWAKAEAEFAEVLNTLGDVEEAVAANFNENDDASKKQRDAHLKQAEGYHAQAIEHLADVMKSREASAGPKAQQPLALRLAAVYDALGDLRLRRVETAVSPDVQAPAYRSALLANFRDAVNCLEKLKDVGGRDADFQKQLGRAYYRLGAAQAWFEEIDEAQKSYETGRKLLVNLAQADALDLTAWSTLRDVCMDFGLCSRKCTGPCKANCGAACSCLDRALDRLKEAKRAQEVLSKDPDALRGYDEVIAMVQKDKVTLGVHGARE